tara:strand:+ start:703 stop:1518 length:816 start_codon:yes stop_codon:yes gene_type:complete
MKNIIILFGFAFLMINQALAHEDNEERIKFWKEYYNPKVEITSQQIPEVKIELIKNKPFYQIKTTIKNFKFTPEKNMKNNLPTEGYGKLYINGEYVSRIYSEYYFLRILPEGYNDITVILSSNLDHDVAVNGKVISDNIIYQFPEYTFSEARNKSYNQMIQCEFSEKGQKLLKIQVDKDLLISESSEYLECRYDARNDILSSFTKDMTRLQKHYHKVTLEALNNRIKLWREFEDGKINIKEARIENKRIEDQIDIRMEKKLKQLQEAQNDL